MGHGVIHLRVSTDSDGSSLCTVFTSWCSLILQGLDLVRSCPTAACCICLLFQHLFVLVVVQEHVMVVAWLPDPAFDCKMLVQPWTLLCVSSDPFPSLLLRTVPVLLFSGAEVSFAMSGFFGSITVCFGFVVASKIVHFFQFPPQPRLTPMTSASILHLCHC